LVYFCKMDKNIPKDYFSNNNNLVNSWNLTIETHFGKNNTLKIEFNY